MGEVFLTALLCGFLGHGVPEVSHKFTNQSYTRRIRVDCETPTHVIEVGLDGKSSSRDSLHQAVFAGLQSGKIPMVLMIDTDGTEGRYEQEMREVTDALGVAYATCDAAFIHRWAATAPFRARLGQTDLPSFEIRVTYCDLGPVGAPTLLPNRLSVRGPAVEPTPVAWTHGSGSTRRVREQR